jgi:hypothetical protein
VQPPFKPQAVVKHTITARYYAEDGEPEKSLVGYVEDKVTFTVLQKDAVHLISEVPKDTLLIGERMPLAARLVSINLSGVPESIIISPTILWRIVEGQAVAKTDHWRELWYQAPPEGEDHAEWWFTGTVAGLAEGTVKVQAVVTYLTWGYPMPQLHVLTGPQYDSEVQGFVDVRLDSVGEWGEEDPGAFMAKDGIEQLMLRTCTAGNVTLAWNSDKVGLFTDAACEEQHKVAEDEGSLEGCRRA